MVNKRRWGRAVFAVLGADDYRADKQSRHKSNRQRNLPDKFEIHQLSP
jgi:hypothetical protein